MRRGVGRVVAVAAAVTGMAGLVLALAGCSTPERVVTSSGATASVAPDGTASPTYAPAPTPTSPFAYGPGGRAALGDFYCVAVVRPKAPLSVRALVSRLGGDASTLRPYRESADGRAFRAGAEELPAATPGRDDRARAVYRIAEQSGAWTIVQGAGRRCIADATLRALAAGGGRAMAYVRELDGEARLAYAVDGTLLVNMNPAILPDDSDRRGARPDALGDAELSGLRLAAESEGDMDIPAAGLLERICGVRLDDRWLAGPAQLVEVPAAGS